MYFMSLVLLSIWLLPFHTVVGAGKRFSTCRDNEFSAKIVASLMSNSRREDRLAYGGDRTGIPASRASVLGAPTRLPHPWRAGLFWLLSSRAMLTRTITVEVAPSQF
jgi:hypothetical protein